MTDTRSRKYCFTLNNYDEAEKIICQNLKVDYKILGYEIGKEGTPHIQGFLYNNNKIGFKKLKELLPRAHIEMCNGSIQDNITYCKKDGKFEEFGEIPKQGKRNDFEEIKRMIDDKKNIIEIADEFPGQYIRYYKGIEKLINLKKNRKLNEIEENEVIVYWGKSGNGKTYKACKENENAYKLDLTDNKIWWDNYTDEKTIIIDDFDGQIPYRMLLQILDKYKLRLNCKGTHTDKNWNKVIITSNKHPKHWYNEDYEPLERRIKEIVEFK